MSTLRETNTLESAKFIAEIYGRRSQSKRQVGMVDVHKYSDDLMSLHVEHYPESPMIPDRERAFQWR